MKTAVMKGVRPKCEIVLITPSIAEAWLKRNRKKQRRIVQRKVIAYTAAVKKDKWDLNGETIKITEKGDIIDGQKRLLSVIAAQKPMESFVVTGLKDKVFSTIDSGQSRAGKDMLEIDGHTSPVEKAAVIRFLIHFYKGQFSAGVTGGRATHYVTNDDIKEFIDANKEDLEEAHKNGVYYYGKFPNLTRTRFSAYSFILSKVSARAAEDFFEKLTIGDGVNSKHPIGQLRNQLIREKRALKGKETKTAGIALFIKAWNLFREKKKVEVLSWNPKVEKFPKPI